MELFRSFPLLAETLMCVCLLCVGTWAAQAQSVTAKNTVKESVRNSDDFAMDSEEEYFKNIYRNFYMSYRLGPGDEISIRVLGQPDYSFSKVKVSPVGRVYHPLVGDIEVVGTTVPQLEKKLTSDFSEYIINPKVSVSLEEAQSAKVGVLGEVKAPAVLVMAKPMTLLEAINSTGGFLETANRSDVILLRQNRDGRLEKVAVNVKKYIEGKAGAEQNPTLRAGDTVLVNGNMQKKMSKVMNSLNFVSFLSFVVLGR
ncbi:MAG: polysaccharide biosynthesis/export family protein [Acidobacteriota bacterium]|nr:polysaccharide biosynthesis/export family protein [Acidobacteriota bacterium]